MKFFLTFALFSFVFLQLGQCVPLSQFYPFGETTGDKRVLTQDDGSTDEVELRVPFVFYGETYFSYFININGILSFLTEIPYFFNAQFPLDYPVIAPFYSDVDITGTGNIWYRETADPVTIQKVTADLRHSFDSASQFRPSSVSIITYDAVGAFQSRRDKVNTFQVVLITDTVDSYVIFNYADGGLQWLQGDGKTPGLPDALGQAGFVAKDGRLYTLRGSGTDQVRNLDRWSNVDQPGVWMFNVGKVNPGKNIQGPRVGHVQSVHLEAYGDETQSCATGGGVCHSSGTCLDYDEGFCCKCTETFYGNGINCIKNDAPIRVTGTLSGNINGIEILDGDLHSYVLATEGRTYTAVSKIPKEVGYDLQSLTGIGEGIAWLFAVPKDGVPNGFTLTGGIFNRSVEVNFPQSGHRVEIQQNFEGLDVFNNVAVSTTISGSLPTIPNGSELELDSFKEEFTRVQPGQVRSRSTRSFKIKGQSLDTPFSVETIIKYEECEFTPVDQLTETLRFKVAENIFILFDEAEAIVRFSFSAKIRTLEEEDPCIKGREHCSDHSQCIVDGDNFRCVCEEGFDYFFDSATETTFCLDMNECDLGRDFCDANAVCLNTPGSYRCQCKPNFVGDGHYCQPQITCHNAGCDPNASCDEINGQPECRCNIGYSGDGFFCSPDFGVENCHIEQNCSPYAVCAPEGNGYACKCLEGYIGDGHRCQASPFPAPNVPPFQTQLVDQLYPNSYLPVDNYDSFGNTLTDRDRQPNVVPYDCRNDVCVCPFGYIDNKSTNVCELASQQSSFDPPVPDCSTGECLCPDGFIYDSLYNLCQNYFEVEVSKFPLDPVCFQGTCLCPFGYELLTEKNKCHPSKLPEFDYENKNGVSVRSCNVLNNCDPNGQCLFYGDQRQYWCTCNAGYTGDGLLCAPIDISCDQVNICHFNADCIYDDAELKSVCVCKVGFSGDGHVCSPVDDCSRTEDCDVNAQCQFNTNDQRYVCICNDGYQGNGFYCSIQELSEGSTVRYDTSCKTLQNCGADAICAQDSSGQHHCRCLSGFEGDGYNCKAIQVDCNILGNCGLNAECRYDEVAQGFQCFCMAGFTGDGYFCHAIETCLNDPTICNPDAICQRSQTNDFHATCVCKLGFTGDGYDCIRTPDHEKNILLMNQGLSVLRMPINKELSNGFPILVDPYMTAVGADIDCLTGRYYWTDVGSRSIRSCKYDGTEKMPVVSGKIGSPEDVAVDWVSKIIYWTDSLNDIVAVADIEGKKIRTIVKEGLVNPRGITVHPGVGLLFWSDWNRDNPKIETSAMDGSRRKDLVSSDITLPNSLVVDYETTSLCWADAGTNKIECIGMDGYGRRVVVEGIKYPFGLTLHQRTFYYTDWNDTSIHEVSKYSGTEEGKRLPPLGGSGKLYGIVAVPEQCPPVNNVCQFGNGGCGETHLCLPNGRGGRTCGCSDEAENNLEKCIDYDF